MSQWATARLEDGEVRVTLGASRAWNHEWVTATASLTPAEDDPDVVAVAVALGRLLDRYHVRLTEAAIGVAWQALERAKEAGDADRDAALPSEGE